MTTVAVFGSCNMDLVTYVETAPRLGETVFGRSFQTDPGGKGANQAVAAARAGARTRMIAAVGTDRFGEQLSENLRDSGVDTAPMRVVDGPSGTAHIVVDDSGANSIVVVSSANGHLDELAPGDEEVIAGADVLLLQLEVPLPGVTAAASVARRHGVRVVLTPAPAEPLPSDLLSVVDLLVPNEHEAEVLTGESNPERSLHALLDMVPEVVITLGDQGCRYGNRAGQMLEVPAHAVRARDTTAAGDTFVGALAVALGEQRLIRPALEWASAASAISVGRAGAMASMPSREQIDSFEADRA